MKNVENIKTKIAELESKLTGSMLEDMDLQEAIRRLKREVSSYEDPLPEKPKDSDFECFGCGS